MAAFSKYVDLAADKLEQAGLPKAALSHMLVGAAVAAWAIKVTYPLLYGKKINYENTGDIKYKQRNKNKSYVAVTSKNEVFDEAEQKLAEAEKLLAEQQIKNQKNRKMLGPGLNKEFINQLMALLKIMIPKLLCYETCLLSVHTICLISRTFLSIYVAALEGAIVKFIVRKDVRQFSMVLLKWFGIAIPATFVNSTIRFLESKLSLAFRIKIYGLLSQFLPTKVSPWDLFIATDVFTGNLLFKLYWSSFIAIIGILGIFASCRLQAR